MNTSKHEGRYFPLLAPVGGSLAVGIGFVALIGWFLGLPGLASFGEGFIPMAPSTAILFVLIGLAILSRRLLPPKAVIYQVSLVITSLGGMTALVLFILSGVGIELGIEHLGFPLLPTKPNNNVPVGHMSPWTALSFVLASVSFVLTYRPTPTRRAAVAFWLISLLLAANYFLVIAYFVGNPLLYTATIIPPALPTSLAFVSLGISLLTFVRTPAGFLRLILAMLVPLVAFILQVTFWAAIKPFAWFLFFPAVFFSSWIGGLSGGVMATVLSTALAWWFFIPPEGSFVLDDPFTFGSIGLFAVMGVLFGYTQERLKRANKRITQLYEAESRKKDASLQEAYTLLQAVTDSIPDAIFVKDLQGRYLLINPAGAEWLGRSVEQVLGKHDTDLLSPEVAARLTEQNIQVMAEGKQITLEQTQEVMGVARTFLVTKAPYRNPEGEIAGVLGIRRDITERKRAEDHIRKLNRVYAVLSDVNQAIVRLRDPQALFETACRIAVEKGNFQMAWIGLLDKATQKMQVAARAGASGSYLENLNISMHNQPMPYCPVDGALRCGERVLCNIIEGVIPRAPCQEMALALGYRASASFPLGVGGTVRGAFTLYSDVQGFFDVSELKILDELAQDISFAMEFSEKETHRQQAEQALRNSEERYRGTLDTMLEGAQIIGFDWRYLYVNDSAARYGHQAKEDLLDSTVMERYPGIETTEMFAVLRQCMEERSTRFAEFEFTYPDGSTGWFEFSIQPVPEGIFILSLDITERKKAEAEILSMARFPAENPNPVLRIHQDGTLLYANAASYAVLHGWTLTEGQPAPPELQEVAAETLVNKTGKLMDMEHSHRVISWSIVPILESGYANLYGRDVTERRRVEQALRESEARFRSAVQESPLPAIIHAEDGEVLQVNQAWVEITGYSHTDIPTIADWTERAYGIRQQTIQANIDRLYGIEKRESEGEFTIACSDGSQRVWEFSSAPLGHLPDGRRYVISMAADVTERRRVEDQVKALVSELEQRVAERTAELQTRNRELETFTYSVSHDLKAPLRGIDGYSRLLLEEYTHQLDEEGGSFLRTIRQATLQMNELIDDLLAYSRLERRPLQTGLVDPHDLIEALVAERESDIKERGVTITVDIPCHALHADPDGLAMALRNLVDNALKFTEGLENPSISIEGHETNTACTLSVHDNGIGFDMKFHDRIFDIFQRLHRIEDYPGTGIGLAIVRKAMERMGGRAWAESELGKGATFFLEVPK